MALETLVHWPADLMPLNGGFVPQFSSTSGGRTWTGRELVVRTGPSGAGFWRAEFTAWPLVRPERLRAWRALEVAIEGRAGVISLPVWDLWQAPYGRAETSVGFSDGTRFAGGAGLRQPTVTGALAAAVARGATAMRIALDQAPADDEDLAGAHFSLPSLEIGPRAHRIARAERVSAGVYDVTVWPWARGAYPDGTPADFDDPRCAMRLEEDRGMNVLPDGGRWGRGAATFREWDPS